MKWQIADQVLMLGYRNGKYQSIKNNEKASVFIVWKRTNFIHTFGNYRLVI